MEATLGFEPQIWARLIQSQTAEVTPEIARYLLSVEFSQADRARVDELADKSEAGTLTSEEQAEYDSYLHVGNILAVMQSRARVVLGAKPSCNLPS